MVNSVCDSSEAIQYKLSFPSRKAIWRYSITQESKKRKNLSLIDESGSVNSHTSDIKIPSAENSSHSSVKDSNRILKITKAQNRKVIPRRQIQSSESEPSSSDDPDQDLLPDIYTTIRPEDNDSSDYGLETG